MALEFDLIETYFKPLSKSLSAEEVGIGDDGAVLTVPENHQMVVVTDTLVCGVHFLKEASAYDIAWKSVAVNLSDLAAMGATPAGYSLGLTLPENDQAWLIEFARGLRAIGEQFKVPLIGGDTTKGPLVLTVTAHGWVPNQQAILRSGAQVGDVVCVTQTIGDGALGLKLVLDSLSPVFKAQLTAGENQHLLSALNRPVPQSKIAVALRGLVNSAADISDGLLADLGHILKQSNNKKTRLATSILESSHQKNCGKSAPKKQNVFAELGADIELTQVPLSTAVKKYLAATDDWSLILSGGDDYQLCMTVSPLNWDKVQLVAEKYGVKITKIGQIVHQSGIRCLKRGTPVADGLDTVKGYAHF